MKNNCFIFAMIVGIICLNGCSKSFWGGAAVGAVGAGAGYELRARQQMEQLDKDYKAGKINQEQYDARKEQIRRESIFY